MIYVALVDLFVDYACWGGRMNGCQAHAVHKYGRRDGRSIWDRKYLLIPVNTLHCAHGWEPIHWSLIVGVIRQSPEAAAFAAAGMPPLRGSVAWRGHPPP